MRVLFAAADVISRTLYAAVLTHAGHDSLSANDGGEAWALFQAEPAPLVAVRGRRLAVAWLRGDPSVDRPDALAVRTGTLR